MLLGYRLRNQTASVPDIRQPVELLKDKGGNVGQGSARAGKVKTGNGPVPVQHA